MKNFARDATVRLKFRFHDADGVDRNPSAANVSLTYVPHGDNCQETTVTYPLVQSGNDWIYEWDSSIAKACVVSAHAETTVLPKSAIDVQFRLTANRANRELVGEQ